VHPSVFLLGSLSELLFAAVLKLFAAVSIPQREPKRNQYANYSFLNFRKS